MTTTPSGPYSIIPDNGSAGGVVVGPGVSNWRPCRNVDDGFNRVTDAYAAGQESLRTCLAEVERERDKERSINARWQEMNRCQVDQIRTLTTQISALREACETYLKGEAPACLECKSITLRSGDIAKCLNCGHERNWWVATTQELRTTLTLKERDQ